MIRRTPAPARDRRAILIAIVGTLTVTAYAIFAAWHILVLNPLAALPGKTLEQIVAETEAANQPLGQAFTIGVLALGVLIALVLLVSACLGGLTGILPTAALYSALLALGAPGYFVASFAPGMSLADTYFISGGDASPWAGVLMAVSAAAFLALFCIGVIAIARRSARAAVHSPA